MTAVTTAAMAVSMLPLFVIGALGPVLVAELGLAPGRLGVLVGVGFGTAAVLSLPAGRIVDRVEWDRCLVALFGVEAAALTLFALAPNGWWDRRTAPDWPGRHLQTTLRAGTPQWPRGRA